MSRAGLQRKWWFGRQGVIEESAWRCTAGSSQAPALCGGAGSASLGFAAQRGAGSSQGRVRSTRGQDGRTAEHAMHVHGCHRISGQQDPQERRFVRMAQLLGMEVHAVQTSTALTRSSAPGAAIRADGNTAAVGLHGRRVAHLCLGGPTCRPSAPSHQLVHKKTYPPVSASPLLVR